MNTVESTIRPAVDISNSDSCLITKPKKHRCDMLVITALHKEAFHCRTVFKGTWSIIHIKLGDSQHVSYVAHQSKDCIVDAQTKKYLRVVVASCTTSGAQKTNTLIYNLLQYLEPKAVFMTGICAGNPKDTSLGDIIVARHALMYDKGKITYDEKSQEDVFSRDIDSAKPKTETFLQLAGMLENDFPSKFLKYMPPDTMMPIPNSVVSDCIMHHKATSKVDLDDAQKILYTRCIEQVALLKPVLKQLKEKNLLTGTPARGLNSMTATRELDGQYEERIDRPDFLKLEEIPKVLVDGCIASGNHVKSTPNTWKDLNDLGRKVYGIDMEGHAFYSATAAYPSLFVKSVSDYAYEKEDSFHTFAMQASAVFAKMIAEEYSWY
ncbi:hypothetical protein AKO1_000572 [Acrasis kona]|uniref:Nucleoside phosphorylase domain-containing protein n=1 Tax=Acrasis kona TaxID=1008807 RepID=A0AAW2Z928_9EUKA